ncbi:MAG: grasp-with-spasm system ATP-grasp peptide maturase [Flavipsychrobacter sp.]
MILILSQPWDRSTDQVIDWIEYLSPDSKVVRINPSNTILDVEININDSEVSFIFKTDCQTVRSDDISSFWFRRGEFSFHFPKFISHESDVDKNALYEHLRAELGKINHFINSCLSKKNHINLVSDNFINKLIALESAKKVGLNIPSTYISTNNKDLYSRLSKQPHITKAISEMIRFNHNDISYSTGTNRVFPLEISNRTNTSSHASLLQHEIIKEIELRVFYVHGDIFTMAIFSQKNKKTKLDYRNYDTANMNRMIPYKLPSIIDKKVKQLFLDMNITSGSADLIYSKNGKYVFLEINPVGQFSMVSYPCNYYLEKYIAELLIKSNGKRNN